MRSYTRRMHAVYGLWTYAFLCSVLLMAQYFTLFHHWLAQNMEILMSHQTLFSFEHVRSVIVSLFGSLRLILAGTLSFLVGWLCFTGVDCVS